MPGLLTNVIADRHFVGAVVIFHIDQCVADRVGGSHFDDNEDTAVWLVGRVVVIFRDRRNRRGIGKEPLSAHRRGKTRHTEAEAQASSFSSPAAVFLLAR